MLLPPAITTIISSDGRILTGTGPSPYLEIDQFIRTLIIDRENCIFGTIRCWKLTSGDNSYLTYEISGGYRYCQNIRRHHKSNNIYFVVNLLTDRYCQRCHDSECYGSKTIYEQLPSSVLKWKQLCDDPWDPLNEQKENNSNISFSMFTEPWEC